MWLKSYWNHSSINKLILSITVIWILLAIPFAFYDLEISKLVVNQKSFFGKFFAGFGELPGLLLGIVSFLILVANIKSSKTILKKILNFLLFLTLIIVIILSLFYFLIIFSRIADISLEIFSKYSLELWVFWGIITIAGIYLFKTRLKKFSTDNFIFAKITSILFVVSFLLVLMLKEFWGRIRFQDLAADFSDFTAWYLPQGLTGGHSFPSGHSMFGWILLPLVLLAFNKVKRTKVIVTTSVIAWGLLVAISRVIIGAHFASDVLFSSGFTIILYLVLYKKYLL
ncbi:MAG: phosphatase PAP2 family protein [Ignavibacteriae bacterium]|nr:phosphatase PAP2 family protein [Ignavibacteriota bacterium]